MPAPVGPHFINVDLEVWSRSDLSALGNAIEAVALVLYVGKSRRKHLVAFEAKETGLSSPEATMWALLKVIRSFHPSHAGSGRAPNHVCSMSAIRPRNL